MIDQNRVIIYNVFLYTYICPIRIVYSKLVLRLITGVRTMTYVSLAWMKFIPARLTYGQQRLPLHARSK